jgi:hypothetical protein
VGSGAVPYARGKAIDLIQREHTAGRAHPDAPLCEPVSPLDRLLAERNGTDHISQRHQAEAGNLREIAPEHILPLCRQIAADGREAHHQHPANKERQGPVAPQRHQKLPRASEKGYAERTRGHDWQHERSSQNLEQLQIHERQRNNENNKEAVHDLISAMSSREQVYAEQ